jgi:hypothetical protein
LHHQEGIFIHSQAAGLCCELNGNLSEHYQDQAGQLAGLL